MRHGLLLLLALASCRSPAPSTQKASDPPAAHPPAAPPKPASRPASQPTSLAASRPASRPANDLPALYAALFDEGRTWTYSYTRIVEAESYGDADADNSDNTDNREKTTRRAKCKVERVQKEEFGWVSRILCKLTRRILNPEGAQDAEGNDLPRYTTDPAGLGSAAYVGNARGLWRGNRANKTEDLKALLKDPPDLPAAPKPSSKGNDELRTTLKKQRIKVGAIKVQAWCPGYSGRVNVDGGSSKTSCYAEGYGLVYQNSDFHAGTKTMDGIAGVEDTLTLISTDPAPLR